MRKIIIFCIVVCCMFLSACAANNPTISFSETNTLGNSMFNYLNHGHTTSQGEWIFFNQLEDDSGIYAQKKNSKNKIQLVSDVTYGSPISVVGKELFYHYDDELWKYNLKTEKSQVVVSEPVSFFIVVEDVIYYSYENEDHNHESTDQSQIIYSITTEGKDKKFIASDVYSFNFAYDNNNLYFVDVDAQFVSVSLTDLQQTVLRKDVNPGIYLVEDHFYLFNSNGKFERYNLADGSWSTVLWRDFDLLKHLTFFDEDTILYTRTEDKTYYKYSIKDETSTVMDFDFDLIELHYVNVIDDKHYYYKGPAPLSLECKREVF